MLSLIFYISTSELTRPLIRLSLPYSIQWNDGAYFFIPSFHFLLLKRPLISPIIPIILHDNQFCSSPLLSNIVGNSKEFLRLNSCVGLNSNDNIIQEETWNFQKCNQSTNHHQTPSAQTVSKNIQNIENPKFILIIRTSWNPILCWF